MARWYNNTPEVKFPDLFFEVSCGLQVLVEHYEIDHTKAELCFMRRGVLQNLRNMGITQDTYDHSRHYFTKVEAEFIELNEMYDTYHSFADI